MAGVGACILYGGTTACWRSTAGDRGYTQGTGNTSGIHVNKLLASGSVCTATYSCTTRQSSRQLTAWHVRRGSTVVGRPAIAYPYVTNVHPRAAPVTVQTSYFKPSGSRTPLFEDCLTCHCPLTAPPSRSHQSLARYRGACQASRGCRIAPRASAPRGWSRCLGPRQHGERWCRREHAGHHHLRFGLGLG